MTTQEMLLVTLAYLIAFGAVIYFTHPTGRRIMGAVGGGAAAGLWGVGAIALCEALGWWRVPTASPLLLYVCASITLMPIYLVTWRLARRFGWRGLAVFTGAVTVIGAPRDYMFAATFPKWMVFSPGIAPLLADAVTYFGIVVLGHAVMRLIAGPSSEDRLARQPDKPLP